MSHVSFLSYLTIAHDLILPSLSNLPRSNSHTLNHSLTHTQSLTHTHTGQVSTFTPVPLQGEALRRWQAKKMAKANSPRTPRTPRTGTPRVSQEGEEEEEESEDDGYENEHDFWALGKVFPMYEYKKPPVPFATAYGDRVVWGQDIAQVYTRGWLHVCWLLGHVLVSS